MNKLVTIISFSSRKNGNCAAISKYISNYHRNNHCLTMDGALIAPCNGCDYECLTPGKFCPKVTEDYLELMNTVCRSDMVYFVVPNYCGYPCANYFAYNERSVGYFNMDREKMQLYMDVPKRFIIVSNTEGFEQAMQQQIIGDPEILYLKSGKYRKRSTAGDILDSEAAKADLEAFLSRNSL